MDRYGTDHDTFMTADSAFSMSLYIKGPFTVNELPYSSDPKRLQEMPETYTAHIIPFIYLITEYGRMVADPPAPAPYV